MRNQSGVQSLGARFSKLPVITGPSKLFPDGSLKSFENSTVKLPAKEAKCTSLEVRTHAYFLETLISKYDFGPVKLPGLSGNGPQFSKLYSWVALSRIKRMIRKPFSG